MTSKPSQDWLDGYAAGQKQKNMELLIELQKTLREYMEKNIEIFKRYEGES